MSAQPWLALQRFWDFHFGSQCEPDEVLARQVEAQIQFFGGTLFGWNFSVTVLCAAEFYFLQDIKLLFVPVACWVLSVVAVYQKRRLLRGATPPTPQQKAQLFVRWMVIAAVSWCIVCAIVVPVANAVALQLFCMGLGIVVSIHAASSSSYMPGYMWFITPTLLVQMITCAMYPNTVIHAVVAFYSPVYLVFMWYLGSILYQIHLKSIQLQLANSDLIQSLTVQTEAATSARVAAEDAGLAKSRFLASASHDLRQPIHAQGLFLDVLARTPLDEQQRQLVNGIQAATQASSEMLHSLLDYSRIEAGVVTPEISAFRVQPVLNKIEREFFPQADAKGLRYRSRESRLVVQSDPALLELILRNLVANAIRYTPLGGVLLVCRQRQGKAVFEVWDTGIGIATHYQQEVFQEFHQLGNPQRDRRNGLGLGLAIVKALSKTLQHPISLTSTVGEGSVFRVELPLAERADSLAMPEVGTVPGGVQLFRVRVLVVDDDDVVRQGMLHLMRDWGCECVGVDGLEDAIPIALVLRPQIIVSDYRLRQHHTGVQVIEAVRTALGVAVPAALITGDTAPDRLREALATGLPLFHKPISPRELYSGLVAALRVNDQQNHRR